MVTQSHYAEDCLHTLAFLSHKYTTNFRANSNMNRASVYERTTEICG